MEHFKHFCKYKGLLFEFNKLSIVYEISLSKKYVNSQLVKNFKMKTKEFGEVKFFNFLDELLK